MPEHPTDDACDRRLVDKLNVDTGKLTTLF